MPSKYSLIWCGVVTLINFAMQYQKLSLMILQLLQPATQSDEEEVNFPPTSETPKAPDADSTPVHPEDLPAASVLTIPGTDREQRYSTRVRTAPQRLNL